ncbi:MAG: isoprenyl transferase [Candidatus Kapabacteria bacterium]|nr:isoprenyl transferase [Candidatus Kapabacteria bacterium]
MASSNRRVNWEDESRGTEDHVIRQSLIETGRLPRHLAVIMDGNGRWAQLHGKPRFEGHREGMESVRDIVKASSQLGIRNLTVYAFSMENWNRPNAEVTFLMKLLETYLRREVDELHANGVRIRTIGKTNALPKGVQSTLRESMERTAANEGLTLTLALSYSARWDILRAVQMLALDVRRGKVSPEDLTESTFTQYLQTSYMDDPDLVIRTSGEFRLSNFLLWESAYSEIYVTDRLWPEFRRQDLYHALCDYARRERRFGKTSAQVQEELGGRQTHLSTLRQILNALR